MKFNELQKEDFTFRTYEYLKTFLALHEQKPIKVIRIDNRLKSKFIVVKQALRGQKNITTQQFTIPIEDTVFFTNWIAEDFPSVEFEKIEGDI